MSATRGLKSSLVREQRRDLNGKIEQGLIVALPADERDADWAARCVGRRDRDLRQAGMAGEASAAQGHGPELQRRGAVENVALWQKCQRCRHHDHRAWLRQIKQPRLGLDAISRARFASSGVMRAAISKRSLMAGDSPSAWERANGISVD